VTDRRLARSALALLLSLVLGASCSSNTSVSTETVARSGPQGWVTTDFRTATPDQIAKAVARFASRCPTSLPSDASVVATAFLQRLANTSTASDDVATLLACWNDAPADASCDSIDACVYGPQQSPPSPATCDGSTMRVATSQHSPNAIACHAFGAGCYQTDVGALCAEGPCAAGETYSCRGDSFVACMHGVRVVQPCGAGRTCGARAGTGLVDCVGAGPDCSGDERCDGAVAVRCGTKGSAHAHSVSTDCSRWGLSCATKPDQFGVQRAVCVATAASCDGRTDLARCDGAKFSLCAGGSWRSWDCADLGVGGTCQASGGRASCVAATGS
jgi:hypothetical protein